MGFVGILCIVIGLIFKVFPPKKINSIYGYRTTLSMKNKEVWDEGQRYSINTFIILGIVYIALQLVLTYLIKNTNIVYENILILLGFVIMLVIDSKHLKKLFNKDGSKKVQ